MEFEVGLRDITRVGSEALLMDGSALSLPRFFNGGKPWCVECRDSGEISKQLPFLLDFPLQLGLSLEKWNGYSVSEEIESAGMGSKNVALQTNAT